VKAIIELVRGSLREPDKHIDCIRRTLKTFLFEQYSAHRVHRWCTRPI